MEALYEAVLTRMPASKNSFATPRRRINRPSTSICDRQETRFPPLPFWAAQHSVGLGAIIKTYDTNTGLHMRSLIKQNTPHLSDHLLEWLSRWSYSRFVTLTLNEPGMGSLGSAAATALRMRERLYQFDARMNRKLIGREWQRRPDNRMWHFFAPEKLSVNPHWHGLVGFHRAEGDELRRQEEMFDQEAPFIWRSLVHKGSVDVKPINDLPGGIEYVAKSLSMTVNWDHCIFPDEFWETSLGTTMPSPATRGQLVTPIAD